MFFYFSFFSLPSSSLLLAVKRAVVQQTKEKEYFRCVSYIYVLLFTSTEHHIQHSRNNTHIPCISREIFHFFSLSPCALPSSPSVSSPLQCLRMKRRIFISRHSIQERCSAVLMSYSIAKQSIKHFLDVKHRIPNENCKKYMSVAVFYSMLIRTSLHCEWLLFFTSQCRRVFFLRFLRTSIVSVTSIVLFSTGRISAGYLINSSETHVWPRTKHVKLHTNMARNEFSCVSSRD